MENGKRLEELKEFHKQLKTYQRYIESDRQLSEAQERYKNSLIEKLQRKFGALKDIITQLSGNRRWERFGYVHNIWIEGLSSEIPLSYIRPSLKMCIDVTNEAIGKLESTPLAELELQKVSVIQEPKAFIAHEGESKALDKLKAFLDALGIMYLIAEKEPSNGRQIEGQVTTTYGQANFVVILATKGKAINRKTGASYMGLNVADELGRAREAKKRVILLLQVGVEPHTNISGIVHERFTPQSMDKAFTKIVKELKNWGFIRVGKIED